MIVIDTNTFLLFIIGIIDPSQIKNHKRTSIFNEEDFNKLNLAIKDLANLIIFPNVWTEVDNLLNKGSFKDKYIQFCKENNNQIKEVYLPSALAFETPYIYKLGLSDSIILEWLKSNNSTLISIDTDLCDIARAHGIKVRDLVREKNNEWI